MNEEEVERISKLRHTHVAIPEGGEIVVLDKGEVINSEAEAMLQALHSRSVGGLRSHLEVLAKRGAANFMKNFYVGYGHKSIGDCGTTTIFVEGVSMLAAKAIQDTMLYSGQEASTRYIDFSKQSFIDPTKTEKGKALLEVQRTFYMNAQEPTREMLREQNPMDEGENEKDYQKAINARAFDITRSLLPAGASTNLAWHTNLRHAADRVLWLRHHPLEEVKRIAGGLEEALRTHHPNSFDHKKYNETEAYQDLISENYYYHDSNSPDSTEINFKGMNFKELHEQRHFFTQRPPKTELPKFLAQVGTLDVRFNLDFGSFRDIQRHRAIVQRMPLLTSDLGFNRWYIENLPAAATEKLKQHLDLINEGIKALEISREKTQYFLPMGYNTSNRFTGDLPAIIYMVELRDSTTVHPTLQRIAHNIGQQINSALSIPVYLNKEQGRFDVRRGQQDIVLKE